MFSHKIGCISNRLFMCHCTFSKSGGGNGEKTPTDWQ
jgi:hypothetical protein